MSWIQKNTPPPSKQINFSLADYSGGLNNRTWVLQPNQASDLRNMAFLDNTIMEKRIGTVAYDTLNTGSSITWIDEYRPYTDASKVIRGTGSAVYADGTQVQAVSSDVHGVTYQGKYFFFDGTNMYVYGIFPQTSIVPFTVVSGTPVTTYLTFKVVNPPNGYTPLDTTYDEGVTHYDFTNKQVWYEPCQNELQDAFKGTNVLPSHSKFVASHKGRLFVSGDSLDDDNVFITDVQNPYYFPTALPMQLPPSSDAVVSLSVFDDGVVVGRHNDMYIIYGDTNRTDIGLQVFELDRLNVHAGVANQKAICPAHNWLFYLGSDGVIYQFGQTLLGRININKGVLATTILSVNLDLFTDPLNFTYTDFSTASCVFHNEEWFLSISDKVLVYSFRTKSWTLYDGLKATSFALHNDAMIWGRSDGQTGTWGTDYYDFGQPFEAYWTSSYLYFGDPSMYKQIREFFITAHTFNAWNSDIRVTFEGDYDDVSIDVKITNQISVFGKSKFGDRFIDKNINASIPFIVGKRIRSMRVTCANGYNPSTPVATKSDLDSYQGKAEGTLVYVQDEKNYYLYTSGFVPDAQPTWVLQTTDDLNQPMRIYQINGDYEFRGRR